MLTWKGPIIAHWFNSRACTGHPKNHTMGLRELSKQFFNYFRLCVVMISLGILLQCPTILWVKNIFLIANQNLLWPNFMPFTQVLPPQRRDQCLFLLFASLGSCRFWWGLSSVRSSDISCFSYGFPCRLFIILMTLLWMLLNSLMSFLYCTAQKYPQHSRWGCPTAEQRGTIPSRAWLAMLGQAMVGHLGCQGTPDSRSTCHQQDPHVPFHGTALQHLIPQYIHTAMAALSQKKNPASVLVKLHNVGDCLIL